LQEHFFLIVQDFRMLQHTMKLTPRVFVITLALLLAVPALGADRACIIGYEKGRYFGNVTTLKVICERACEEAEGLPAPDFKMGECQTTETKGNVTLTTTFLYECQCKADNDVDQPTRTLCNDSCDSGANSLLAAGLVIMAVTTVAVIGLAL
jgi:hypothetical protein